jgi:hypothetical protein
VETKDEYFKGNALDTNDKEMQKLKMFGLTFARSYLPRGLYNCTRKQFFASTVRGKLDNDSARTYSVNSSRRFTSAQLMVGNVELNNGIQTFCQTVAVAVAVPIRFFSSSNKKEQNENSSSAAGSAAIRKHDKHWENMLHSMIEYREEHGNTLVPTEWELNRKLGTWVDTVRQNYRYYNMGVASLLNEERIERLEKEGFVWAVHEETWEKKFEQMVEYKEKYGNFSVPNTEEFHELTSWMFVQRRNYVKRVNGEKYCMPDDRVERLSQIGFVFDQHEDNWTTKFEELKDYKRHYGDCLVPKTHHNKQLMKWVEVQRSQYKNLQIGDRSSMSPERLERLESVNFVWNANEYKWLQKLAEMRQFFLINGHCKIPVKGNTSLRNWVRRQKSEYRKMIDGESTVMDENRINLLREAGLDLEQEN